MILGITGGIASGKSSVTDIFRALGAAVVSADQLAREAVRPGQPGPGAAGGALRSEILLADGSLDRRGWRRSSSRPAGPRELNRITHPAIAALAEARLAQLRRRGARLIIYEAPLLFEAGAEGRVDEVLVVRIDPACSAPG